jgi:hypothetical protein
MPKPKARDGQNFLRLLNDLKSSVNLDDYNDDNWCENYEADEYFLYILCWAAWREKHQESVWKGVRDSYVSIGKSLHKLTPFDVKKLCKSYPLDWQRNWLRRIVDFLVESSLSAKEFVLSLRKAGYEKARCQLQGIVRTDSEKIVDCWLRDIVKIDAFPIDTRIKGLLREYRIPVDSEIIIECCKKNNVPIRPFARALYEYAGTKNRKRK